jgi:hypothetical protein
LKGSITISDEVTKGVAMEISRDNVQSSVTIDVINRKTVRIVSCHIWSWNGKVSCSVSSHKTHGVCSKIRADYVNVAIHIEITSTNENDIG